MMHLNFNNEIDDVYDNLYNSKVTPCLIMIYIYIVR